MTMTDLDVHLQTVTNVESMGICRDRYGWFNVTFFQVWACSQCYNYLFPHDKIETHSRRAEELVKPEDTWIPMDILLYPDLFEGSAVKDATVCSSLGEDKCLRLTKCCQAAVECCSRQASKAGQTEYHVTQDDRNSCPRTWDGFACFQEVPSGQVSQITCPAYIDENTEDGIVEKLCTENGTWAINPANGMEWTDYSACVSLEDFRILYYICITCNAASLLCLVPACIIFIKFKQLRKQHRIRIHLNLFVSFILTSCAWLGWDHLIFRDRMENPREEALMHKSEFQKTCILLYVISRYSWACNCVWMLLEGFHLYRLINHAFKAPKSILNYYFIGWLFPLAPVFIYSIVRLSKQDNGCWVRNASNLEWILYGPILMCILVNVAFLVNILRILLTQIQTHPNEPSNYRRALKATFILVPLFGLQLFLVVYRPNGKVMENFTYEVIANVISNSQGAAVATVFCFLNSERIRQDNFNQANDEQSHFYEIAECFTTEDCLQDYFNVHGQFRTHMVWVRAHHSCNDIRSCTLSTEMRRTSGRDSRPEKMPLNCTGMCHANGSISDRRSNSSVISLKWQMGQDGRHTNGQFV